MNETYRTKRSLPAGPGRINRRAVWLAAVLPVLAVAALTGCSDPLFKNDLQAIQARGALRVVTRNNATCFYEGPHRKEGFEYDLVSAFAAHLGVELELTILDSETAMLAELMDGRVDVIAAGFLASEDLRTHVAFGPVYHEIEHLVVGRRGGPDPRSVAELVNQSIWVMAGAFHEKQLNILKKDHPRLSWLRMSDTESEELLEMVWKGVIPLTMTDSNTLAVNRRYYPELLVHLSVGPSQPLAWVFHDQSHHLQDAAERWFAEPGTQDLLQGLKQHYYGHLENFDYVDITTFRTRLKKRLPAYRKYFEAAAAENDLDWKLIAAQSYQESHWNPKARSFTGVRGMMMLTLKTAHDMGVTNRLNAEQSILGGARYLARLYRKIDAAVPEPDRLFMALAAYNVGWGHLEDARRLCIRLDKNANAWSDIRATLPLLRLKKYYKSLPHGYARGNEPVRYVDRIRTYHRIMVRWEKTARTGKPAEQPPADTSTGA
jgi:membrane-bound lytic murein transglycosylase F